VQARSRVGAVDEARVAFFREHFRTDIRDPGQFDFGLEHLRDLGHRLRERRRAGVRVPIGVRSLNSAS
jgi:hypothetical protein